VCKGRHLLINLKVDSYPESLNNRIPPDPPPSPGKELKELSINFHSESLDDWVPPDPPPSPGRELKEYLLISTRNH